MIRPKPWMKVSVLMKYGGCRVNTKDNPNCFCALVPPPNGARKSGLWEIISDFVESLGPDPNKDLLASADSSAGLTNLGATCYANGILQCLCMNKLFRHGIAFYFKFDPSYYYYHKRMQQQV